MVLNLTEASSLAIIDRQLGAVQASISPAQYEIIRQVIYHTADLEYQSLLQFSDGALAKGAAALTTAIPIIVDVPEVQVSVVPHLQKTFANPVYCCATNASETDISTSKAANGLEILSSRYPNSIFILGQDQAALVKMIDMMQNKTIEPSLAIATAPMFIESAAKQKLKNSYTPKIYINSSKGGANVASAIFNSLINLAWRAKQGH
ncbi:MAG: precorrin-8X methylmutase [Cyanobacteria bacterium J06629_2]